MGRDERANLRGLPGGLPIIGGGDRTLLQPAEVRDALNRVLFEGDGVLLNLPLPPIFFVQQIERVVDPQVPPGFMEITVISKQKFRAPRGVANNEFTRIVAQAEGFMLKPGAAPNPDTAAVPPIASPQADGDHGEPT